MKYPQGFNTSSWSENPGCEHVFCLFTLLDVATSFSLQQARGTVFLFLFSRKMGREAVRFSSAHLSFSAIKIACNSIFVYFRFLCLEYAFLCFPPSIFYNLPPN